MFDCSNSQKRSENPTCQNLVANPSCKQPDFRFPECRTECCPKIDQGISIYWWMPLIFLIACVGLILLLRYLMNRDKNPKEQKKAKKGGKKKKAKKKKK